MFQLPIRKSVCLNVQWMRKVFERLVKTVLRLQTPLFLLFLLKNWSDEHYLSQEVKGFAYTSTFSTCNLFHTARCARSWWGQVMFLNWETTTWGITMARLNIEKFPTSHTKCKDYLRHLILERRMQRRFLQSNGSFVWSVWSFGLSSFVFFFIYSLLKYIYLRKYHARFKKKLQILRYPLTLRTKSRKTFVPTRDIHLRTCL